MVVTSFQSNYYFNLIILNCFRYQSIWSPKCNHPPYNHVCQIGDPVLRQKAAAVHPDEFDSEKIKQTIRLMRDVMLRYHAVGLAAPQIGIPLKIIMIEFPESLMRNIHPTLQTSREITAIPLKVIPII